MENELTLGNRELLTSAKSTQLEPLAVWHVKSPIFKSGGKEPLHTIRSSAVHRLINSMPKGLTCLSLEVRLVGKSEILAFRSPIKAILPNSFDYLTLKLSPRGFMGSVYGGIERWNVSGAHVDIIW